MGKVIQFPDRMKRYNEAWSAGYSDGYRQRDIRVGEPDGYYTGYDVGKADRAEDDEAIASGQFDLLTEEERREVYGVEDDRP